MLCILDRFSLLAYDAFMNDLNRRKAVSFDAFYFEKESNHGRTYTMEETFQHALDTNLWGSPESCSGEGSTEKETQHLRQTIAKLLKDLKITSLLDAPCGDFGWLSKLDMTGLHYTGMDILENIIKDHQETYKSSARYTFIQGNIVEAPLPRSDLILCRDCLVHLSNGEILRTLENFKRSGSRYLLTTTFQDCEVNMDIVRGDWRLINLTKPPFNLPEPDIILTEGCLQNEGLYADKSLGLWDLRTLSSD